MDIVRTFLKLWTLTPGRRMSRSFALAEASSPVPCSSSPPPPPAAWAFVTSTVALFFMSSLNMSAVACSDLREKTTGQREDQNEKLVYGASGGGLRGNREINADSPGASGGEGGLWDEGKVDVAERWCSSHAPSPGLRFGTVVWSKTALFACLQSSSRKNNCISRRV